MRRIVIAGGSIAGISAARQLRKSGFDGSIDVVDADRSAPYRRPAVSKAILTGHNERADIEIAVPDDLELNRHGGVQLTSLDVGGRTAQGVSPDGDAVEFPWDALVLATGSQARAWELGRGLDGIYSLRSVADGLRMRQPFTTAQHVVIVGGGFIGLEVASAARSLGIDVTVIEVADVPLAHVLGPTLGGYIAETHRDRGVHLRCGTTVVGVHGHDHVESVTLSDGSTLQTDLVLACVGSQPATDWLASSGLDLDNGVICDEHCVVDDAARIVAAGDIASWVNPLYGMRMRVEHWANAIEQGSYAARALLGVRDDDGFSSVPYFWSEQCGTRLQSIGTSRGYDESIILARGEDALMVGYGRHGRLIGVAGISVGSEVLRYRARIASRTSLESLTDVAAVMS